MANRFNFFCILNQSTYSPLFKMLLCVTTKLIRSLIANCEYSCGYVSHFHLKKDSEQQILAMSVCELIAGYNILLCKSYLPIVSTYIKTEAWQVGSCIKKEHHWCQSEKEGQVLVEGP